MDGRCNWPVSVLEEITFSFLTRVFPRGIVLPVHFSIVISSVKSSVFPKLYPFGSQAYWCLNLSRWSCYHLIVLQGLIAKSMYKFTMIKMSYSWKQCKCCVYPLNTRNLFFSSVFPPIFWVFLLSLCSWRLDEKHCTLFSLPPWRFELFLSYIIPHEAK